VENYITEKIHDNYIKTYGGREKHFNLKPTKKDLVCGDCVVRAITIANNIDYKEAWKSLFKLACEKGFFPNHDRVSEEFLFNNGWVKVKIANRKIRTKDIFDNYQFKKDKFYILHLRGHWVAMCNNVFYDTWDSYGHNGFVFNIYEKK